MFLTQEATSPIQRTLRKKSPTPFPYDNRKQSLATLAASGSGEPQQMSNLQSEIEESRDRVQVWAHLLYTAPVALGPRLQLRPYECGEEEARKSFGQGREY